MNRSPHSLHRKTVAAALAAVVSATTLASAVPAFAAPKVPTRAEAMRRAQTWTSRRVPYSQQRSLNGWRTDCSGFVSMAWNADKSYTTYSLPEISHPIAKDQLKPGDIMLNRSGDRLRHVVMFGGWANRQHTSYVALEQNGQTDNAVKRVMPYPYRIQGAKYKPYRFNAWRETAARPKRLTGKALKDYRAQAARYVRQKAALERTRSVRAKRYARHRSVVEARFLRHKAAARATAKVRQERYARHRSVREARYTRHRAVVEARYLRHKAAANR